VDAKKVSCDTDEELWSPRMRLKDGYLPLVRNSPMSLISG
jgi:hypothetical protein